MLHCTELYSILNPQSILWRKYKRPFYWLRLTDDSAKKLLKNNAEKLIDPDLRRKYELDLETRGDAVYEVERNEEGKVIHRELMARVLSLSTFYSDKGSGLFDKDFLNDPNMYYNICLDEMNREKNEKNTFDIVYAFTNQLENLVRSTKQRLRIICIGNTLEEASDILCCFNFIPEEFGRYKLKSKPFYNPSLGSISPEMYVSESGKEEKVFIYVPYTEEELLENRKNEIRKKREEECFPIINRGTLWYNKLTDEQKIELSNWYDAWLNAPETLKIPEILSWIK